MAVGWSQRARADLGAIFAHIAADNRGAAERWIGLILEHADLAAEAPLLGRIVPELGQTDIRETYLRSYRIVYRTDGHDLWVLTVFEGSGQLLARRAASTFTPAFPSPPTTERAASDYCATALEPR